VAFAMQRQLFEFRSLESHAQFIDNRSTYG